MSTEVAQNNNELNGEVSHESTLFAEPVLHAGNFTITNSLLMSWVTVVLLVTFFIAAGRKAKKAKGGAPRGIHNLFEIILDQALNMADSVTGERKKTLKFLPIVLALFLFILVSNWMGLLPGVGTIGFVENGEHGKVFIPLFRGATADVNTTLAIALFSVVMSHVFGVITVGLWGHFNKFVNVKAFVHIVKKVHREPMIIMINPIKIFVGFVEIIGEIAKVASLSLRLFGNIFAGEVLLASMMALFAFFLPLPFMFLEVIVGIVQALVFSILTLAFMSIAATHEEH